MLDKEKEERFLAWVDKGRFSKIEDKTPPVKFIDIVGSFQYLYTQVKEGRQTTEEMEKECEELLEGFMEVLLKNLGNPEVDWGEVHSDLQEWQEYNDTSDKWTSR